MAPDIGTGKVLAAARLRGSTARHSTELRCQGVGKKKTEDLKTSRHWVPSICLRHRSCWRTSRLPARSSPAQLGEGETQVIIRSCSHLAPGAGALPKPPRAGGRACSHPSGGEQESRLASVAFSCSPVTVPGAHRTGRSSPGSSQQKTLPLCHPTVPSGHGFVRATHRQKGSQFATPPPQAAI